MDENMREHDGNIVREQGVVEVITPDGIMRADAVFPEEMQQPCAFTCESEENARREAEWQAQVVSETGELQMNPVIVEAPIIEASVMGEGGGIMAAAAGISIYAPPSNNQTFYQGDSVRLGAYISGATWARINVYNPSNGLVFTYESPVSTYIEYNYWNIASNATVGTYRVRISTLNGSTETAYAERTVYVAAKTTTYYTISYYANGGSGTMSSQSVTPGNGVYLLSNNYTRSGYTFLGWSTNSSSSYAQYSAGSWFTPSGSTIMYAIWQYNGSTSTYTVSYNPSGGSGSYPSSQTVTAGNGVYLQNNAFTRSGYSFLGWSTNSGSTSAQYSY